MESSAIAAPISAADDSTPPQFWRAALRSTEGRIGWVVGLVMIGVIVGGSLFGPSTEYGDGPPGSGMSAEHWFGTDSLGRDVLSRFLEGGTTVLWIPLVAVIIALVLGGGLGLLGAYRGGWADNVITKAFDVVLTVPPLLIVLVIIGALGASTTVLIVTVGLVFAPPFGRVVRGTAQSVLVNLYVAAAKARGERASAILLREITPNIAGPVLAEFGLRVTYGILFISTLSFLGLGVQPPAPDWGLMIAENRNLLTVAPWGTLLPAIGIAALAVSLNLMAEALSNSVTGDESTKVIEL